MGPILTLTQDFSALELTEQLLDHVSYFSQVAAGYKKQGSKSTFNYQTRFNYVAGEIRRMVQGFKFHYTLVFLNLESHEF